MRLGPRVGPSSMSSTQQTAVTGHGNARVTPYHYLFTRKLYNRHWTVELEGYANGTVKIVFHSGPYPHWHNFQSGASLWEATGHSFHGSRASRITALRFIACGLRNMQGFCICTANNQPSQPRAIGRCQSRKG